MGVPIPENPGCYSQGRKIVWIFLTTDFKFLTFLLDFHEEIDKGDHNKINMQEPNVGSVPKL